MPKLSLLTIGLLAISLAACIPAPSLTIVELPSKDIKVKMYWLMADAESLAVHSLPNKEGQRFGLTFVFNRCYI